MKYTETWNTNNKNIKTSGSTKQIQFFLLINIYLFIVRKKYQWTKHYTDFSLYLLAPENFLNEFSSNNHLGKIIYYMKMKILDALRGAISRCLRVVGTCPTVQPILPLRFHHKIKKFEIKSIKDLISNFSIFKENLLHFLIIKFYLVFIVILYYNLWYFVAINVLRIILS